MSESQTKPNEDPDEDRADAQGEQIEAQKNGALGAELRGFAKEVGEDLKQFPKDVVLDSDNPERREDEPSGTPVHEDLEPRA